MRFRRPSVSTLLGITRAKKRFNSTVGITAAMQPFRAPGNARRRILRQAGYYIAPMKWLRLLARLK